MFVEINGVNYNMYSISSFSKTIEVVENSDHEAVTTYVIYYSSVNGTAMREVFDTMEARDEKYNALVEQFVYEGN